MPDWLQAVLAFISGSGLLTGIGMWFKWRREDRLAERIADATQIKEQNRTIFDLQQERIKDAQDRSEGATRIARALEHIGQQVPEMRAEIGRQLADLRNDIATLIAMAKERP